MALEREIHVDLDGTPYPVYIGKGVVGRIGDYLENKTENTKAVVIYDRFFERTVATDVKRSLEDKGFSVFMYGMDAGKTNKNINEALKVFSLLEENNIARDSTLIAIGGGVIGDMAGFIASTWLRGINLVHIPTTLIAMVDSSIGGKTAINFRQTINGIGSYYHPILNLIDLNLVDTLSDRDYRSGLAEVVKCAVISDAKFFDYLDGNQDQIAKREHTHVVEFINHTVDIKIKHVQGDVKEGGKRLLLNYGHTLGHSVEISTEKDHQEQLRHGEGVSVGIMAAVHIAAKHLGVPDSVRDSVEKLFLDFQLPVNVSASELGFDREKLLAKCIVNVHKDKKRLSNRLRLILAEDLGFASVYSDVPNQLVEEAFDHIIKA